MPQALPQPNRSSGSWTPLQRRAWLANARRRSRKLFPAPVLRPAYPSLLRWDWDYTNPVRWNIWQSLDHGGTYFLANGYWEDGDLREFAPDGGSEFYFIVGVDAAGTEITGRSNAVRPDDAPLPPPDAPQNLTVTDLGTGFQLNWVRASIPAVSQIIQRKDEGGDFQNWLTVDASVATAMDTTVATGHYYVYRVQAVNSAGASGYSNEYGLYFNLS